MRRRRSFLFRTDTGARVPYLRAHTHTRARTCCHNQKSHINKHGFRLHTQYTHAHTHTRIKSMRNEYCCVIRQRLLRRRVSCKDVPPRLQRRTHSGRRRRWRPGGGDGRGRTRGWGVFGGGFYRNSVERNDDDDEDYLGCFRSVGRARHNTEAPCVHIFPLSTTRDTRPKL